jgi:serine/threonine protein kinase
MANIGKRLNGELIGELMRRQNLTSDMLLERMADEISHQTLGRAMQGVPVSQRSGVLIADALDVSYADLLHPTESSQRSTFEASPSGSDDDWREWRTDGILSAWITASNGLQYRLVKMRHCEVTDRIGRGKVFDLAHLGDDARRNMRHALARHGDVCERLCGAPGVPVNLTVCPNEDASRWLIVDQWIEGETLERRLEEKTLEGIDLKKLLKRIAETLDRFHKAEVLRRELSPRFILMREDDDYLILTDFELGKLFAGTRTVSNGSWRDDPYRAPEVETGEIQSGDYRADLYSWGRIAAHLLVGWLPSLGKEQMALREADVPKRVKEIIVNCAQVGPSGRPDRMTDVLKVLRAWK